MKKIINILKKHKELPLDKFINISLYNKESGYYMKKNPFGSNGDFITSPLISNLFGEMIAIWCVSFWEHLNKPKKILLVELGPGNGFLCKDLIKVFKKFENFYNCLEINLLEISEKLKKKQKKIIKNKKVKWIKNINKINSGPIIFIGNEFFDSLPIKQIFKKKGNFFEKYITWSLDDKKIKVFYKLADRKLINKIKKLNLDTLGNLIEYPIKTLEYLNIISKKIKKFNGSLLTFDYGHDAHKSIDTLQALKKHKYTELFSDPGNIDITTQINFKLLKNQLEKNNMSVEKIVTQNEFLQKMGILERAEILSKKMNFSAKANMFYRLKRLLHPNQMGKLYKVMLMKKKNNKFGLGF